MMVMLWPTVIDCRFRRPRSCGDGRERGNDRPKQALLLDSQAARTNGGLTANTTASRQTKHAHTTPAVDRASPNDKYLESAKI